MEPNDPAVTSSSSSPPRQRQLGDNVVSNGHAASPEHHSVELERELEDFRRQWIEENTQRHSHPGANSSSNDATVIQPVDRDITQTRPAPSLSTSSRRAVPPSSAPRGDRRTISQSLDALTLSDSSSSATVSAGGSKDIAAAPSSSTKNGQKTALEVYAMAVNYEREGRLNEALTHYRRAFKMDPDVDRSFHRASLAPQGSSRLSEPHQTSSSAASASNPTGDEFKFERTVQVAPDYVAHREHRSVETVERKLGKGQANENSTHPSSTTYLFETLMNSVAQYPFDRQAYNMRQRSAVTTGSGALNSPPTSPRSKALAPTTSSTAVTSAQQVTSVEEAFNNLGFIPEDPDKPCFMDRLPREVLIHILRIVALTSLTPAIGQRERREEVNSASSGSTLLNSTSARASKRHGPRKKTLREHTRDIELELGLEPHDQRCVWKYLRFYDNGLVISLLSVDTPNVVVRHLTPSLRVKGLTFGRWRLRDEADLAEEWQERDNLAAGSQPQGIERDAKHGHGAILELWGLEDPSVDERRRKYSFRMTCRLKSTARGRMNKLEMLSMATEHRTTLELCDVPIKPTKPFFFSKVASYAGEDDMLDQVVASHVGSSTTAHQHAVVGHAA
ncbi:hypothetical protein OIO90_005831 [Microbotryomycetes sp. JL221]|nr:hypothetical protein OIO90_005831 [Microbotryomycetes sp. JL221]